MARPLISASVPAPIEYAISPAGHIKPIPVVSNITGPLMYGDDGSVLVRERAQQAGWRSVQSEMEPRLYEEFLAFQRRASEFRRSQKPADWPDLDPATGLPPHLIPPIVAERRSMDGVGERPPEPKAGAGVTKNKDGDVIKRVTRTVPRVTPRAPKGGGG